VPILKQINRHNEDGSYSYGYEAADGSFKIETKAANGEVKGKYGYVDDSGNLREIEYGANQNGFQPSGDGINVAPAAAHNSPSQYPALAAGEIDDGQYREDPNIYNDPKYNSKPSKSSQFRVNPYPTPAPARPSYVQPEAFKSPEPAYRAPQPAYRAPQPAYNPPQPAYNPPQQNYYQPQSESPSFYQSRFSAPAAPAPRQNYYQQPQPAYRPQSSNYYQHPDQVNIFQGHPASNLDLSTGSYSVTYG
jgi:Insect cuticle protein